MDSGLLRDLEWSGDLRIRNEQFWYDRDLNGVERDNRNRFRYRLRFGFKKELNDWLTVGARLASGVASNSGNVSLGDSSEFNDEDFGNDAISIDQAYGLGFEVGSSKKLFKAGFGWFHVEANATPALITDSDLFDAHTNREGYTAYFQKRLFNVLTFKLTYFDGEEIEDDAPFGFPASAGSGSDRRRLQSDLSIRF